MSDKDVSEQGLVLQKEADLASPLKAAAESASFYISESMSANTKRVYQLQWRLFCEWCHDYSTPNFTVEPLPAAPETVAMYLAWLADEKKSWNTICLSLAVIQKVHKVKECSPLPRDSRLVQDTMRGIARRLGTRSQGVDAVDPRDLRAMVAAFPDKPSWTIRNVRNKAMLLLGFAGAMRRSELVALNAEDIKFVPEGLTVLIRRSKTDQTGEGLVKAIPLGDYPDTCPVRAVREWLDYECACEGEPGPDQPLFPAVSPDGTRVLLNARLSDRTVANIVQASCKRAAMGGRYAGHSLRAGLVTTAARHNMPLHAIMAQTGHTSVQMVMRYIREQQKFAHNAAKGIGL